MRHSGAGTYAFACGVVAAFLTAFYSWRLLILTFHGRPRADQHTMEHVHESPRVMLLPLVLLACGAVLTGVAFEHYFVGEHWPEFWRGAIVNAPSNHVLEDLHHTPVLISLLPTILAVAGIALAYLFYWFAPAIPARIAAAIPGIYRFVLNKWYFDELYDFLFVRPAAWLARQLWQVGDATIIDGIPNGVASIAADGSAQVVKIQTGSIAIYAFSMLIGVVLLVGVFLLMR